MCSLLWPQFPHLDKEGVGSGDHHPICDSQNPVLQEASVGLRGRTELGVIPRLIGSSHFPNVAFSVILVKTVTLGFDGHWENEAGLEAFLTLLCMSVLCCL